MEDGQKIERRVQWHLWRRGFTFALGLVASGALLFAAPVSAKEFGFITEWGSRGYTANGQFERPENLAADPAGNIYVADTHNGRVQKFNSTGDFITKWGSAFTDDELYLPKGIAADADGGVYVTDPYASRIQKFTSAGSFISAWGDMEGNGNGEFNYPLGIATDSAGLVYVADTNNHRIQKFSSSGAFIGMWGSDFWYPSDISIDSDGNAFVLESFHNRILKFTSTGSFISEWGGYGAGNGEFNSPQSITTDPTGNVYVADTNNSRIQKFTSTGTFISKWGIQGAGAGEFSGPRGVTSDKDGNIYVADTGNSRIQKFGLRDPPPPTPPAQSEPRAIARITRGPTGRTSKSKATFGFAADIAGAGFQCRLTGRRTTTGSKKWKTCASPKRINHLKPGKKTFQVRAVKSGRVGPVAERSFRVFRKPKKPTRPTRPGRKLDTYVVNVDGRYGKIKLRCRLSGGCQGSITIKRGNTPLVKRRKYSIRGHHKKYFRLRLTPAGFKILKNKKSARATGTLIGKSGKKLKIIAILKR